MANVLLVPDIVTVDVPLVMIVPDSLVSQLPDTPQEPDVSVMVPVTAVIATSPTVTVAWLPLTTPPALTVSEFVPKVKNPELPAVSVRVPVTDTAPAAVIVPVVIL